MALFCWKALNNYPLKLYYRMATELFFWNTVVENILIENHLSF